MAHIRENEKPQGTVLASGDGAGVAGYMVEKQRSVSTTYRSGTPGQAITSFPWVTYSWDNQSLLGVTALVRVKPLCPNHFGEVLLHRTSCHIDSWISVGAVEGLWVAVGNLLLHTLGCLEQLNVGVGSRSVCFIIFSFWGRWTGKKLIVNS